ncbi:HAMP domain-containing sensor histidine kinase [Hydrogenophaga pseudoflava]|uniref:HAMP domain-containing sensor histidine kinase n=1 Tax=Hydrogenophaga pseudoflava TaxID=47421 RepID=UPI0027E44012|nr:HAMP domain-containing sensor histidine kinase [Hydrogenophaga pseudoflava]MDQ7746374.1 HAMP domain-containing sensor histidine kinase [Hydrogenophaga pseudoflava]
MLRRLPYRVQIPLGLSLAVLLAAVLVTAITARVQAQNARRDTLSLLDRAVVLVIAQVRPLLAADDTWRVFSLLRDTAQLVPGADADLARLAILTPDGAVFAASDPVKLETGRQVLGEPWREQPLLTAMAIERRALLNRPDGSVVLIDPIRSEDGQTLGFVFTEVESAAFAPDWASLARTALIGIVLAVTVLGPLGWWVGKRMARPVGRLVAVIERIGRDDPGVLRADVPKTTDPELSRIGDAVAQLMGELERRKVAEERALSAERLAAVGKMTAAVAHEINNPLAGMLTATQTLRLHGGNEAIRLRTIDLLDRGLQQIRTTVAALLPQARIEDRPLEPGDLEDIVALVKSTADKHRAEIRVQVDVESALRVPSAPLRQVMLNLLLNALKAAGEHGVIAARLQADESRVRFCISNSGPVLSEDKFKSTLAAESGKDPRGFGLWVCQELASHLRGRFELDITETTQTCLLFEVPNREAPEGQT